MRPQNRKRTYRRKPWVRRTRRRRGPRRQNRRQNMRVMKCPTSFPDRMKVKLSFGSVASTLYQLAAATSQDFRIIMGKQPFEIPVGSLSAINPQGWDQWINSYDAYRVLGMKVRLSFRSGDNVTRAAVISSYWSSNSTPIGTVTGVVQNRYSHVRVLGCDDVFEHKTFARPWTVLDATKREYLSDINFIQSTSINPPSPASLYVNIRNTSNTNNLNLMWKITGDLYVEFRYPKTLLDS